MKDNILAFATFSGTIIGVGLFGLPFVASKIGYYPMLFYFGILTIVSILVHQIFGEICLRTNGEHRLPGYAQIYLGKPAKWISIFSTSIGLFGSNLAYIVIGGSFLSYLLQPIFGGDPIIYILLFFISGALLTFFGFKSISRTELLGLIIIFFAIIYMFAKSLSHIDIENMLTYDFSLLNLFLPYGVILFSLSGMSIVPEVVERLRLNPKNLKGIFASGIILAAVLYIMFIFLTLGVTGRQTTADALSGLKELLGNKVMIAGYILGVLATFTSYISSSLTLKKIFSYDINLTPIISWIIAVSVPILLYLLGINDFILIIGFVGAVTMGIDSLTIFLIYLRAIKAGERKPEYELKLNKFIIYGLGLIFILGAIIELIFSII